MQEVEVISLLTEGKPNQTNEELGKLIIEHAPPRLPIGNTETFRVSFKLMDDSSAPINLDLPTDPALLRDIISNEMETIYLMNEGSMLGICLNASRGASRRRTK